MERLLIALTVIMLAVASCAVDQSGDVAQTPVAQGEAAEMDVLDLTPPGPLVDDWSQWLVGQWDCVAESDLPGFKAWVRGRGQMTAELTLGGQFLLIRKEGRITRISDEYIRHLRQNMHASKEDIEALRNMAFGDVEFHTIEPRTGRIVAYLFDSWRCAAQGVGQREGNVEVLEWEWSLAGAGTSVRTTEKAGDNKIVVTEKYTLVDGSTMEDRVVMVRRHAEPAGSGDFALLLPK